MTTAPRESMPVLRVLRERATRLQMPLVALWEVTQRCNLRCRHCYLKGKPEDGELSTAEAKDLLKQMAGLGVMFLALTGGEPLLRPDFFELVDEARALGFAWRLLTAGTLIGDRTARDIFERRPHGTAISLYGLEETHDWMTSVPGSFRASVGAIKRLAGLGVPVIAKTCLTPQGLADLPALRALCAGMDVRLHVGTIMYPGLDGAPVHRSLRPSDEELARHLAGRDGAHGPAPAHGGVPGDDDPICSAGRSAFAISPRGDIRACIFLRRVCGNVRETPLSAIWHSEAMVPARRLNFGARLGCRGCQAAPFCFFCPGLAEAETGEALSPPPSACREARIRRRLWETRTEEGGAASGPQADQERPGFSGADCEFVGSE